MSYILDKKEDIFLTQAQYNARELAGTLVVGSIYHITDSKTAHSNLSNLDYAGSGHTGFEPITTTSVSSASTTPTATLVDNNEYVFSNTGITTLGITLSSGYSAGFMSSVVFINSASTPTITITNTGSYTLKYKGDGVSANVYTPTANTTATMIFNYDGINMNIYISEV